VLTTESLFIKQGVPFFFEMIYPPPLSDTPPMAWGPPAKQPTPATPQHSAVSSTKQQVGDTRSGCPSQSLGVPQTSSTDHPTSQRI
jgi:hypothetical protein